MPHIRTLLSLAPLVLIAASVAAQSSPPPLQFSLDNSIEWPGSFGSAAFKRVIVGDFNADGIRDAAVLSGTQAAFLNAPTTWRWALALSGAVNDIDSSRGLGTNGYDAIAAVASDGLKLYTFNLSTHDFSSSVVSSSSPWLNAKLVRSADINGSGVSDYVGVASDARTVILRYDVSGTPTESSFTTSYDISDILLLQWDNDSPLEIACLDTFGVEVFKLNGTRTAWFANSGTSGDAFTSFRVTSDTHDHIAWVVKNSSGQQTLNELSRHDGRITAASTFPANTFAFIAAADSTGSAGVPDGNSELVVARNDGYYPIGLLNLAQTAPSPNFSLDTGSSAWCNLTWSIPVWNPSSTVIAPIAYTDVDGDGIPDLLVPVHVGSIHNHIDFLRGTPAQKLSSPEVYDSADFPTTHVNFSGYGTGDNARNLNVVLSSAFTSSTGYPPSGANSLEVILWQESGGSLNTTAVAHLYYTPLPTTTNLNPIVPIPGTDPCFGDGVNYWLETRYAVYDSGTNKFTKSWESSVAYLTTDKPLANSYYVSGQLIMCLPSAQWCDMSGTGCNWGIHGGSPIGHAPALVTRRSIAPGGSGTLNPNTPQAGTWGS